MASHLVYPTGFTNSQMKTMIILLFISLHGNANMNTDFFNSTKPNVYLVLGQSFWVGEWERMTVNKTSYESSQSFGLTDLLMNQTDKSQSVKKTWLLRQLYWKSIKSMYQISLYNRDLVPLMLHHMQLFIPEVTCLTFGLIEFAIGQAKAVLSSYG